SNRVSLAKESVMSNNQANKSDIENEFNTRLDLTDLMDVDDTVTHIPATGHTAIAEHTPVTGYTTTASLPSTPSTTATTTPTKSEVDPATNRKKKRNSNEEPRPYNKAPVARLDLKELHEIKAKPGWKYLRPFLQRPVTSLGVGMGDCWNGSNEESEFDADYIKRTKKHFNHSAEEADPLCFKMIVLYTTQYFDGYLWKSIYKYERWVDGKVQIEQDVHYDIKSKTQLKLILENYKYSKKIGKKMVVFDAFKIWSAWENRHIFKDVEYNPIPSLPGEGNLFNLYEPGEYIGKDRTGKCSKMAYGRCSSFFEHVREIWCCGDEKLYVWTRKLLAYYFQKPHIRPDMAVVLYGQQGSGKTLVVQVFGKLFASNFVTIDSARFNNKFNTVLDCKLVAFWDESEINKLSTLDTFKNRITAKEMPIEGKFKNTKIRQNYLRWFIASNNELKTLAVNVTPT
ncbi:hypothetical protein PROFUN_17023, partial [Planoprotostelium fungivorum]